MIPVRRSRLVQSDQLTGVVVEIDATGDPSALAVLQSGLHELPPGQRLVFGYHIDTTGLGAWVEDQQVRIRIWPALLDDDGDIVHDHSEGDDAELHLVFHPTRDRAALADLARVGRLIVAGPDSGPVPLVLDVDVDLVADVVASLTT
ncbi:MAG: hypothetical protein ABI239_14665 [Aquihabitans sp.]